jgi:hypothetical protein
MPAALAPTDERSQQSRLPQPIHDRDLKVDSIPIAAASAANASSFIQTPQSKVSRPGLRACPQPRVPGHFRLSHSVSREVSCRPLRTEGSTAGIRAFSEWRVIRPERHSEKARVGFLTTDPDKSPSRQLGEKRATREAAGTTYISAFFGRRISITGISEFPGCGETIGRER